MRQVSQLSPAAIAESLCPITPIFWVTSGPAPSPICITRTRTEASDWSSPMLQSVSREKREELFFVSFSRNALQQTFLPPEPRNTRGQRPSYESPMPSVTRHSNHGKCTLRPRYCTQIAEFRVCLYSIRGQSGWERPPRRT